MSAARTTVLVIDDEAQIHRFLSPALDAAGFDPKRADSGQEGLRAIALWSPDAVLLDLGTPGMSGLQFALRFRDLPGCGATPIVAVTGYPDLALSARGVGIDHYLLKPMLGLSVLRDLLKRLTVGSEPSRPRTGPWRRWESLRTERRATV